MNRRYCLALGLPILAAALALAGADRPAVTPDPLKPPFGPYRATVVSVHDGDTGVFEIALGFDIYTRQPIRIFGINSPELHTGTPEEQARGRAARDYLAALLPPGTPVRLSTTKDQTRTFTRWVGSIAYGPDAKDVAGEMVRAGHAGWADANADPIPGPVPPL